MQENILEFILVLSLFLQFSHSHSLSSWSLSGVLREALKFLKKLQVPKFYLGKENIGGEQESIHKQAGLR